MGIGALVIIDEEIKMSHSRFVPIKPTNTNNIAEYLALGEVLHYLVQNDLTGEDILIQGDSQLAIKQMTGEYGMNSGAYIPYAKKCLLKIGEFKRKPILKWIPREQNEPADKLSKGELDKHGIQVATHSDDISVLTFGKYKGKSVNVIEDVDYLKWILENVKLKEKVRVVISQRISQFQYLAK